MVEAQPPQPEADVERDVRTMLSLLRDIGRERPLRDPLAQTCEELGLSPPQVHALLWIGDEPGIHMGLLARRSGITEKTATGMVDRLEKLGLVRRERDPADRRVVRVVLSQDGGVMAARMAEHISSRVRWLMQLIDVEDRAALLRILEKVGTRMNGTEER